MSECQARAGAVTSGLEDAVGVGVEGQDVENNDLSSRSVFHHCTPLLLCTPFLPYFHVFVNP